MDGVLTRTAALHLDAWTRVFNEFLAEYNRRTGDDQPPFSRGDYRRHVDGKPRYDGAEAFLRSRGIELPRGDPSDVPSERTVCALGNRKNEQFQQLLRDRGVAVYKDAVAACRRWKRGGLQLAIITSSKNGPKVLDSAGLLGLADTIVDGVQAAELGLDGKEDLIREAARRIGTTAEQELLLEDSVAGIAAGKRVGCGLVVGVDRDEHAQTLREAGADQVVQSVGRLRFRRTLPLLQDRRAEFESIRADRPLALFVDFDGTLSPIVNNPQDARISPEMRAALRAVAARHTVAVVSGRDRSFVEAQVGIEAIWYAGSHGLDIAGPDGEMVHPDAGRTVPLLDDLAERLREALSTIEGVYFERKRFSLAVHYRNVQPARRPEVKDTAARLAGEVQHLRAHAGKMVLEIQPALDWDKGSAVEWLIDALSIDPATTLVLYVGDDETDEDAFRVLNDRGLGIYVGPALSTSLATYRLENPAQVLTLLQTLVQPPSTGT
jgi:alpha,alpha-trehalase